MFLDYMEKKPKTLIGCVHLPPMPGTPYYEGMSIEQMEEWALADAAKLADAGFDAFVFANEGDRPYTAPVGPEVVSIYTRIVRTVTQQIPLPFGVGVLVDPIATLGVAKGVGADFVRMYISGVFASVFGLSALDPYQILSYRKKIGAESAAILLNVTPHAGTSLDTRSIVDIIDSLFLVFEPEVLLLPGPRAGLPPDQNQIALLREKFPTKKMIVSSGVSEKNAANFLSMVDGLLVGTCLKKDGILWNPVDANRAKRFVAAVKG